jgi:uncharacterized iron-regulated membrane protein
MRKLLLKIHLYAGLTAGAVFVLAALTGSLLVFYVEIDALFAPELRSAAPGTAQRASLETVFRSLRAAHPDRTRHWRIEVPADPDALLSARYMKAEETAHLAFAPLVVMVDPSTAQVRSSRFWGEFAMTWIYDLHYTLLLDRNGRIVMALIGGALTLSLSIGVYLWWPARGKWRNALRFKRNASRERFTFDLHKLAGVYGLVLLLVLCVTGVLLEVPQYANPLIDRISPRVQAPALQSAPFDGARRIPLDDAVRIAQGRFPGAPARWIETPDGVDGVYRIQLRQPGEPSERFPRTTVWVDQYSGKILAARDPHMHSSGDVLLAWLHPLHSGEAFGLPGRLLVLFTGILPPVLFVTGVMRWAQKRRVRKVRRVR